MKQLEKGFIAEKQMIAALNGKKMIELNHNLKLFIKKLFGDIDDDTKIGCKKFEGFFKPDFVVTCDGVNKYISMKSGMADTVHEEQLSSVITFLHRIGISDETLETIRLFQYADGTIDGTGSHRMNWREAYETYDERIKKANIELNSSKKQLLKIMDRFLFQGVDNEAVFADAIYHGNIEDGVLVLRHQFERYFLFKSWKKYDSFHIGPIIIKPHSRFIGMDNKEIKNEHLRHRMQFRWPKLKEDMIYMNKYYFHQKSD